MLCFSYSSYCFHLFCFKDIGEYISTFSYHFFHVGLPGGVVVKNPPANAGDIKDVGLIPGWGRSPEGGHGNPLQCPCLENPMDGGTWLATVHAVAT